MKDAFLATALTLAMATGAHAATIRSAVSVEASSQRALTPAVTTINQSGLYKTYISGVTDFDTYLSSNPIHSFAAAAQEWFSGFGNTTAWLTFDLGDLFIIDRIALWTEDASGFTTAKLSYSTNGKDFASLSGITATDNTDDKDYPASVFGLGTTTLRYFRMDLSGCPQSADGTDECSLGEIAFSSLGAGVAGGADVPLPGAGLLALTGLGALAALRRKSV